MRKKFVQIASLCLAAALLCVASHAASGEDPATAGELSKKVMRVGIYYGDAGKSSINLTLTTGDGFRFGTCTDEGVFEPFSDVAPAALTTVTVSADSGSSFGIVVTAPATGEVLCSYNDGGLGTGLAIQPYSDSGEKTVTKCGYPYYGAFRFERFRSNNDLMTVVNIVGLDDYVEGVVPYEVSASWPLEALKAQAVCARTYALSHISASHQSGYHFDLCDSTHCQVYKGVYSGEQASRVQESVESTSGVTVRYDGAYCETLYSSCNGGASESSVNVFGSACPYLIGKTDPYEAEIADIIPEYRWTRTFTGAQLQAKLQAAGYTGCGTVTAVRTKLSDTGNVIALTFSDENGKSYTIYRDECRTFLSLRSIHYAVSGNTGTTAIPGTGSSDSGGGLTDTDGAELDLSQGVTVIDGSGNLSVITEGSVITADGVTDIAEVGTESSDAASGGGEAYATGSAFTFTGAGWGHNVGMSQYGAYAMAELGYTYTDILTFYYTGVTVG